MRVFSLSAVFLAACVAAGTLASRADTASIEAADGPATIIAAEWPSAAGAQDASGPWPDPLVSLYETRSDAARPIKLRFTIVDPGRAASRVRSAKPKPIGTVVEARPSARPTPPPASRWPSRPATLPPAAPAATEPAPAARLAASTAPPRPVTAPAPAPAPVAAATPSPPPAEARRPSEVRAAPAPVASRVEPVDPRPGEEERIRTTLARFRTAYSQLDAGAAREVWPSVDMRALERAFDGLKSQELRFERCNLTVEGPRAKAACTGRAVYVPRIGNQSPRSTSREWNFELRKADDERWTIASARSS